MNSHIITIDGPSASGKGTIAKLVAKQLNFNYLDSGLIYRALAFLFIKHNIAIEDNMHINSSEIMLIIDKLPSILPINSLKYYNDSNNTNKDNIILLITTEFYGMKASILGKNSQIRAMLLPIQRLYEANNLVTDGRDMGSVVFPHAFLKIFLTASLEARSNRRFLQLQKSNPNLTLQDVVNDISNRDTQDISRKHAPLIYNNDYYLLDNSHLNILQSVAQIINWYNKKTHNLLLP